MIGWLTIMKQIMCVMFLYGPQRLTRFNKISHPNQRPRWQGVDEEATGLWRDQKYIRVARPPKTCVNLIFKYIRAASSYTIRR